MFKSETKNIKFISVWMSKVSPIDKLVFKKSLNESIHLNPTTKLAAATTGRDEGL